MQLNMTLFAGLLTMFWKELQARSSATNVIWSTSDSARNSNMGQLHQTWLYKKVNNTCVQFFDNDLKHLIYTVVELD